MEDQADCRIDLLPKFDDEDLCNFDHDKLNIFEVLITIVADSCSNVIT